MELGAAVRGRIAQPFGESVFMKRTHRQHRAFDAALKRRCDMIGQCRVARAFDQQRTEFGYRTLDPDRWSELLPQGLDPVLANHDAIKSNAGYRRQTSMQGLRDGPPTDHRESNRR